MSTPTMGGDVDPDLFLADLERKPRSLRDLAAHVVRADPWSGVDEDVDRVLFLGMGSSTFAAAVAAARLRAAGLDAVADLASSDLLPPPDPRTLVVAISASGKSRETVEATRRYLGRSRVVALTNADDAVLARGVDLVVPMLAGPELGGVACRTFQHTLALLLVLVDRLSGGPGAAAVASVVGAAADASEDLLRRRPTWLPAVREVLDGPQLTAVVAPARRLSSAQQSALMLREGPRRPAVASETGEWSHVDVYLTKTTDYRMLLFPGSTWEDELLRWTTERGSRIVAVGGVVETAEVTVRYPSDDDDDVRLLTEVMVPEVVAASMWQAGPAQGGPT
jgi:glutamine---fructose-6-phosphate transaminase (isomerizing)